MMASLRWKTITLKGVQIRRYKGSLDEKKNLTRRKGSIKAMNQKPVYLRTPVSKEKNSVDKAMVIETKLPTVGE